MLVEQSEIRRAEEDQTQEAGARICSGRSPGSRQVEEGSCEPRDLLEAGRGSQPGGRLGSRTEDVPAGEEEEDGSCQEEQAGSCSILRL